MYYIKMYKIVTDICDTNDVMSYMQRNRIILFYSARLLDTC